MVLESRSRDEAVQRLESYGVASACHMLIADETGGIGLEWSAAEVQRCTMNSSSQVFHTNHYLLKHQKVGQDTCWLEDSPFRVARVEELANRIQGTPTREDVFEIFKDEQNHPGAICRAQKANVKSASLFNIVMDLKAKRATVTLGRPVDPDDTVELVF